MHACHEGRCESATGRGDLPSVRLMWHAHACCLLLESKNSIVQYEVLLWLKGVTCGDY